MSYRPALSDLDVAILEISGAPYNDTVSVVNKKKSLLKFGKNPNVGTSWATIMEFQTGETNESYVTTNAITSVVSDSASNTQVVTIEGHTIDGSGNLTFATQDATLNGQTPVLLTTPLARATRAFIKNGTFASPATDMALSSNIYIYEGGAVSAGGVPTTASETHLIMTASADKPNNQSFKASTSISSQDYAIISEVYFDVLKKTTAQIDIRLEVRELGGVWRPKFERSVNSSAGGSQTFELSPYRVVPPSSDIRITALSSTSSTAVSAGFNAYLAIIT